MARLTSSAYALCASVRAARSVGSGAIGEELDQTSRIGEMRLSLMHEQGSGPARDDVEAAILKALHHLFDPAGASDLVQPVVRHPDDAELRSPSRHSPIIVL